MPEITRDRWGLVAVSGVLAFVAMLDMSVVTVALADIGSDLQVSPQAAQWTVLGYQLAVVALLLPAGSWLDTAGIRPTVIGAVGLFAAMSALAAISPNLSTLIAARVVQGCAGAVIFVLMPVLAARSVRPELRGRAMSVPATLGPLGAVLGPAIGGVLLDTWGWQAIFLIKIPFCLAAMVVTYRVAQPGTTPKPPTKAQLTDAALVATAVAAALLALTFAVDQPAWLLLALLAVPPAWRWLRRDNGRRAADTLTTSRTWGVNGAVLALGAAFAAMNYLVAIHLQTESQVSATATGLTVLAFPIAMALAGPFGGRLADRHGARVTSAAGAAITALGLTLLLTASAMDDWTPVDIAWRMAVAGLGMGLYGGPTQALVMSSAPPDRMASASSVIQVARSLGFALGPAIATALTAASGTTAGLTFAVLAAVAATAALATTKAGIPADRTS